MRVSLNLYRQPNFASSRIIKASSDQANDVVQPKITEADNEDASATRPVVGSWPWIKPYLPPVKEDDDCSANLKQLNSYILNTSAHEDFDAYPVKYEDLFKDYQALFTVIHYFQSPRELVQYYADFFNRMSRTDSIDASIANFILSNLEHKIDFDALGISESGLSAGDKAKLAALFDFWSVSLDGKPRNGFEKPDFIRSTEEYLELLSAKTDKEGQIIAERKLLTELRISKEELEEDRKLQETLNAEHAKMEEGRKQLPFWDRGIPPNKLLSPMNRMDALLARRLNHFVQERERVAAMVKDSADMAQLWHEFLGGDLD